MIRPDGNRICMLCDTILRIAMFNGNDSVGLMAMRGSTVQCPSLRLCDFTVTIHATSLQNVLNASFNK